MAKKRKNPPKSDPAPTSTAAATASTEPEQVQQQSQPDPEIKPAEPEIKTQEEDDATIKEESFQFDDDEEFEETETETDDGTQEKDENAPNGEAKPEEQVKKEDTGDDENEPIQKLLEPFTKDQLIEILTQAAESHTDVLDKIRKLSDTDPVHRKIFVHGLGWDTTSESLTEVFKQYGEIEDCNCVTDKITGKSKGYAFILYKSRSGARKALKEPQKKIGNRMTACQLASAGPVPTQQAHHAPAAVVVPTTPASEYTQRKIYVSNVGPEVDPQKLIPFFSKFGEIEEGPLGLDKHTGKPKGFALFVYKSIESAKKALEEPHKNFEGTILHCQKAIDGPKPNKQNYAAAGSSGGGRPSKFQRTDNSGYGAGHLSSGVGAAGHLMAQSGHGMGYNQAAAPAINPIVGQALTALLASQGGGGLGLTNLLGTLGAGGVAPNMNPAGPPMSGGYGSQYGSGYGSQTGAQGGYYSQAGQGSGGRSQKGGYMGGANPYLGHGH